MKLCIPHHESLIEEIKSNGLSCLICKNGEIAIEVFKRNAEGDGDKSNPADFDPLMSFTLQIYNQAVMKGWIYLLEQNLCSLCELEKNGGKPKEWIEGSMGAVLNHCRKQGLIYGVM